MLAQKIFTALGTERAASGLVAVTPAATVNIDPSMGVYSKWTIAQNCTINFTTGGYPGQIFTLIILNDGTIRTITWGTKMRVRSPTQAGTANRTIVAQFISDGVDFYSTLVNTGVV